MSEKTLKPKEAKTVDVTQAVLTETALGIFKDPLNGEWCLAEIKYNPLTNETGEFNKVVAGPYKDFAIEKFKMAAVEYALVG